MKKSVPIEAEMVYLYCDECGGQMMPTGIVICTYPPMYEHQCAKCGKQEMRRHEYPRIIWKEKASE